MADKIVRGILGGNIARVLAVDVAGVAEQTRQLHELRGDAAKLAAEAVVASVFLAGQIKGEERVSFQLQGSNPVCAFIGDVDATGGVRARFTPAVVSASEQGSVEGMLLVIKSLPGKELYRGVTAVESETIEEALSKHLGGSSQVDTILCIRVEIENDCVVSAGGVLIERLPADPGRELEASAEFIVALDPVREMTVPSLFEAISAGEIEGISFQVLEDQPISWRCSCGQERVEAVIASLPLTELTAMLQEDGRAEVICHFCNIAYEISGPALEQMILAQASDDMN
jgi:molecular chaperone Hsp33